MKRTFYLAIGVFLIFLAIQCLVVEKFEFYWGQNTTVEQATKDIASEKQSLKRCEFIPPEWLPWSLLSPGILIVLYGLAMEK